MQLQHIQQKINKVRGLYVILDFDLAESFMKWKRSVLNQAVKRNFRRFPDYFMFQLSEQEWRAMPSQFVMTSYKRPLNSLPFAFTEQGLAMLSGVLHSEKAIEVNIAIMRAFVFLRQYALTHKDLTEQLVMLEMKYDKKFEDVHKALHYFIDKERKPAERTAIGFKRKK